MSLYSSSSSNVSHPLPPLSSSNSSPYFSIDTCFKYPKNVFIFMGFSITSLLLLPLFVLVLCVGHRQRRKQRSVTTGATMSHSDVFTYHMIVMEVISIVGNCFCCCGSYADVPVLLIMGLYMFSISSPGQTLFHILTCVERYLAVVHPITYLRHSGRVRIRNFITGCAWVSSFSCLLLTNELVIHFSMASATCFLLLSLFAVTFCSMSVVCVLIRPRPGDRSGDRERVDHLKQRAVNTIMVILAALLVRLMGNLSCTVMYSLAEQQDVKCELLISSVWFSLPSSLVLPLLFLHRARKLPG